MAKERIIVAMSGGVDSSTAAALLKQQGYEVIGITMQLWDYAQMQTDKFGTCCSLEDVADARRVANIIGIPFYVANFQEEFDREVVEYFLNEYINARTPNPCIMCNAKLKFHYLLHMARQLGASKVATGHYARVCYDHSAQRYSLKRGVFRNKDQSYFLFSLNQKQLASALFPVGGYTKEEVRNLALSLGLRVESKRESQEICFIPDRDYTRFIKTKKSGQSFAPGRIVNLKGDLLGYHQGLPFYTIGQRKGLGVATGKPFYVTGMDLANNLLIVGDESEAKGRRLLVEDVNWIVEPPEIGKKMEADVKIRYRHPGNRAEISILDHQAAEVEFLQPQWAITPGQAAVFYKDDFVLGGGWIARRC